MSLCLRAFLANRVHGLTNLGHSSPSQFLFIMQSDKPVFQFQRVNLGERLLPAPPCRGLLDALYRHRRVVKPMPLTMQIKRRMLKPERHVTEDCPRTKL